MYKMIEFSAETFAKNRFHTIKKKKTGKKPVLWIRTKDIKNVDVKNPDDLVKR